MTRHSIGGRQDTKHYIAGQSQHYIGPYDLEMVAIYCKTYQDYQ